MGIKDLFDGGRIRDLFGKGEKAKKQEEFREALKGAVMDGKLSQSDIRDLEALREDLGVAAPAEDKTEVRRDIYDEAVDAAKRDGAITATGVHELAKIQRFLGLRDDQVGETRFQVARLRTLTEIRKGNLPVVPDSSVALRDVALEAAETAHYTLSVDILGAVRQADPGVPIGGGLPYPENTAAAHRMNDEGAKELGEATLILTNRRIVLKTRGRVAAMKLADARLRIYDNGLRLERAGAADTLLRFRSRSDETAEIVGEILSTVLNPPA